MLQEWEGCSCSEIYVGSRAILAVNVAGYSRLMAADESGMLAALKSLREELMFETGHMRNR